MVGTTTMGTFVSAKCAACVIVRGASALVSSRLGLLQSISIPHKLTPVRELSQAQLPATTSPSQNRFSPEVPMP